MQEEERAAQLKKERLVMAILVVVTVIFVLGVVGFEVLVRSWVLQKQTEDGEDWSALVASMAEYKRHNLELERQACEANHDQWDAQELVCIEADKPAAPVVNSAPEVSNVPDNSSTVSSTNVTPSSSKAQAYGSDPNKPDEYSGAGASLKDKQLRAHILCKNYAGDYFYPSKVSFSSITGVVTDEEQYYGWRYDVIIEVKSAAGGKQSYIMHCIAGSFNQDYSGGKVVKFEVLRR